MLVNQKVAGTHFFVTVFLAIGLLHTGTVSNMCHVVGLERDSLAVGVSRSSYYSVAPTTQVQCT
jgi:hypothetical protein